MDIKTYLIDHYPEKQERVEEYIKWNGEYINNELRAKDIETFLIYLYPERKYQVKEYIKRNEEYLDPALKGLYQKVDEETAVELIAEMIMNEVLRLLPL